MAPSTPQLAWQVLIPLPQVDVFPFMDVRSLLSARLVVLSLENQLEVSDIQVSLTLLCLTENIHVTSLTIPLSRL